MVPVRYMSTPPAASTRPTVGVRTAIQLAAATRQSELSRSLAAMATTTQRSATVHSATTQPATTTSRTKLTPSLTRRAVATTSPLSPPVSSSLQAIIISILATQVSLVNLAGFVSARLEHTQELLLRVSMGQQLQAQPLR